MNWKNPIIKPGHVIVDVDSCGICGTDLHVYKGMPSTWPIPGVRGHEVAGVISECAKDVSNYSVGDRVVIQPLRYCGSCPSCQRGRLNLCYSAKLIGGENDGGFAEKILVPVDSLFNLPQKLSLGHAVLAESLATQIHAFNKNICGLVESMVIFGAGAQGLLSLMLAKYIGVRHVYVVDILPHRLQIAKKIGASEVFNSDDLNPVEAIMDLTNGYGVNVGIDTAGQPSTRQQLVLCLNRGGTGVFIAIGNAETNIDFMALVPNELKLHGTQCYMDSDFQQSINLLTTGDLPYETILSSYPLKDGANIFNSLVTNPGNNIKVILKP